MNSNSNTPATVQATTEANAQGWTEAGGRWRVGLPVLRGVIARRLLLNYRCDPAWAARLVPAPLRPLEVRGAAIVGLCVLRLAAVRPRGWPTWLGLDSENLAYRVAVTWDEPGGRRVGVHVLRRFTGSRWNRWAGGRVFPGEHLPARFESWESARRCKVSAWGPDGGRLLQVVARLDDASLEGSLFPTLAEASAFHAAGSVGWSQGRDGRLEGMELRTVDWRVEPVLVERLDSAFYDDRRRFPAGCLEWDHGLLMRGVDHEWHATNLGHGRIL